MSRDKFYITTAISYPNGKPHIGHAYEMIATDALARFQRARRQGRVLPDRHRRARHQDAADGAQGRHLAARARRPQRGRVPAHGRRARTCRTTISSAPRKSATMRPARRSGRRWPPMATSTRTATPAGTRCATRPITARRRPRSAPTTCATDRRARRSSGSRRRAISSGSRPTRTGCLRSTRASRTSSARRSAATR